MRSLFAMLYIGLLFQVMPARVSGQDADTNYIVSETMKHGCVENPEWSESWVAQKIKPFLPTQDAPSLRLQSLQELEAQTDLAIGSIRHHCLDYHAGKLSRHYWDLQIKANEEQIAEFERQLGEDAIARANQGQVSDMPDINKKLVQVLGVGRQAALLGMDERADQARQIAVQTLIQFSGAFHDKCYGQEFDPDIALSVERENELQGTGIDLKECAFRKFAVQVGPMYLLESCSLHGFGDWRFTWSMNDPPIQTQSPMEMQDFFHGTGKFEGLWRGDYGVSYKSDGDMHLTRKDTRDSTGKLLERHYYLSGNFKLALASGADKVNPLAQLMGKTPGGHAKYNQEVEYSQKPCKSVDDKPPPGAG